MNITTAATAFIHGPTATPTLRELVLFKGWLLAQFQALPVQVEVTEAEVSPEAMITHHAETGTLLISTAFCDHPHLSEADNVRFRAVHDWHHISRGLGFDWAGEQGTLAVACESAPSEIHWILTSEIALQAAAAIVTGEFHPQRLVRV
jgi:hypothetical protein